MWENSGYLLGVLEEVIKELTPDEKIDPKDFAMPNHYAKLVWEQAQRDLSKKILGLFPEKH